MMNIEKSSSARDTFSLSLFVAVDDPQSVRERLDLRDVTFDLCFGVPMCFLMSFSPPYPMPKTVAHVEQKANVSPLRDFLTQLNFVTHSPLNETRYFFFFAFLDLSFSTAIMLLKLEERVKTNGAK